MDLKAIGMGLLFALIWSSAFTSARIIVSQAPPLGASALRFAIAGVIGVIVARALGQTWKLSRGQWRATIIFGLCQNAIYLGLNFVAMQWIEASLASIIASTMPLMVAIAGVFFLGERLSGLAIVGLIMGTIGVMVIMGSRVGGGVDLRGVAYCFIAAIALTAATLSVRGASLGGNLMMVVGLQMFVGAAVLGVISLLTETRTVTMSWQLGAAFSYTVIVPGLIGTWIWFALVGRIGAVRAATFHFLNPFFGVATAAVILGEALSRIDIVGVAIISAGILAVQSSKRPTI